MTVVETFKLLHFKRLLLLQTNLCQNLTISDKTTPGKHTTYDP